MTVFIIIFLRVTRWSVCVCIIFTAGSLRSAWNPLTLNFNITTIIKFYVFSYRFRIWHYHLERRTFIYIYPLCVTKVKRELVRMYMYMQQLFQFFIVDKNIHESMRIRTSRMLRHRHMHLIGFYTSKYKNCPRIFTDWCSLLGHYQFTSNISFPHC